ncbi:MAG: hypothetical protein LBI85_00005, partial [Spirochaetaceae bacterium]|nr:hypothetical protein [Spirochaetaceae bacterium]
LLNDPDIPLESKAQAVFDEAGKALLQTIGEQGAASLDQAEETTTRLDNLSIARQMETAGKNAKAARLATGWERGADGKWRYEIPDIKVNSNFDETAALAAKNQESYYTNLGQIVEGKPELFAAYPELKNMQVYFDPAGRLNGRYSGHITIEVPPFRADSTLWAMESLLIHEIQHAIQEIEGFASGGNKGQFIQQNSKQPILDGIEKARLKAFNEIPENLKEAARKVNRNEDTDGLALDQIQADPAAKAAWADYIRALANAAEIAGIPGEQFDGLSPEEQYRRLAGEVEARNAEARIGFTPRQRLETLLEETEDVAREDQIFLARGVRMGAALTMRKEDTGKTARVVDIDPDIIVDENGQAIDIKNTRDLTKWILDQYMPINEKGEREGIEVKIADDEVIQKFTSSGLKASLKSKNRKQRPFYADLIKIIENAVFDHFELSDSRHEKGLQGQNVYYSAAKINKDFYSIRIKIDVSKYDKIKPAYKDHKVAEIKIEPSLYRGYETTQTEGPEIAPSLYTGQPNVTRQDEDAITDISLSVLKGEVKPSRIEGTTLFQTSPQTELDDNYFKALESGDMETAQRMVDAQARKNGYISTDEYRISHRAPNSHSDDGFFPNLTNVRESGIVPDNYWTIPRYYLYGENDYKAFNIVMSALNSPNQKITMYRAIPKNTKEAAFRNGDWITPLYEIADAEGATTNAPYRIISQEVFLSDVWWDGDTITAFGYDDGKDYVYKNTKNNRKLNDVIVRDYEGNIVPPSKRFNYRAYEIFFQTGDRDMVEEAAEFEDGKGYRGYIEAYYELPQEVEGFSDEQIDAWFDEFVERAKQAVNAGEQGSEAAAGNGLTPADVDREFNELIGEPGKLDEFVKMLADTHNHDYGRWQAVDEEDEAERGQQMEITDTLRRRLTHPTWQSIFKANGEMGPTQRKQLLTLIRKAPRDYRAIYADVMEQPEFAVSAEGTAAAALKYRITDSRRQDLDSLSPEKLRQLAEQWDIEDFAEKVQTGKAQFNEPVEKAYIQQLQKQRKEVEQALKEVETDRKEDNEYLERIAGKQFMDTLDRAVKAREEITRNNEKLDRAIANNQKNAAFYTRRAQRAAANYNSIVQTLDDLAKARDLELDVREVLEDQRIHDAVQAAKKELRTEAREKRDALKDEFTKIRARERTKASLQKKFAVIMAVNDLKAYQRELKERQDAAKELTRAKSAVFKRILRPLNPRVINADQGRAVAIIQRFAEPSMLEGIDRFIGSVEKPYLRAVFKTWKVDEASREKILEGKKQRSREKIISLLDKESFDHLTNADKKYLYRRLANDWIKELG